MQHILKDQMHKSYSINIMKTFWLVLIDKRKICRFQSKYELIKHIILLNPNSIMLSFNIDYLTKNIAKNQPRTKRSQIMVVSHAVAILKLIQKKSQINHLRNAFLSILAKPRTKLQKLQIINPLIKRRQWNAFFNIKRFAQLSHTNEIMVKQRKYDYPVSIIQKACALKKREFLQQGINKLRLNQKNKIREEKTLCKIELFVNEYIRRNIYVKGFRAIELASTKSGEYARHLKYFQYIFESARMRVLFTSFTIISIKMFQRNLVQLDKQRATMRNLANKGVVKRNQAVNELKRKLNNMKGQVSEGQILNNKKMVDWGRQNGTKLIKKNEEMRIYQINTSYLQYDLFSLEREFIRKQDFIKCRAGNTMKFEQLKAIYEYINSLDTQKDGKLIYSKFIPTNKQRQIQNKHNFVVTQNARLKHLTSLYERMLQTKKTDSYNNAQNENGCLKMLVASLLKTLFMQPQKDAMMQSCNEIQSNLAVLLQESENLKKL